MIIPIGHERDENLRWPYVTLAIVIACIGVYIYEYRVLGNHEELEQEARREALEYYQERPYLSADPRLEAQRLLWAGDEELPFLTPENLENMDEEELTEMLQAAQSMDTEKLAEIASEFRPDPDTIYRPGQLQTRREQGNLEELTTHWLGLYDSHPLRAFGLIASDYKLLDLVTYMFFHAGFWHLFGNLLLLYLAGPAIEDVWGRPVFALFYLTAGVISAAMFAATYPGLNVPLVGASGAIAGVMGAFLVRHWKIKIKFFYWIFFIFTGTFRISAWVVLPLWVGQELLSAHLMDQLFPNAGGPVAHWAHVWGFAFGVVVALLIGFMSIEERFIRPRLHKKLNIVENVDLEQALEARHAGRPDEAWQRLHDALGRAPYDVDLNIALWDLAVEQGRSAEAIPRMIDCVRHELRGGDQEGALQLLSEVRFRQPDLAIDPKIKLSLAEALLGANHEADAQDLLREATEQMDLLPPGLLVRAARLAQKLRLGKLAYEVAAYTLNRNQLAEELQPQLKKIVEENQVWDSVAQSGGKVAPWAANFRPESHSPPLAPAAKQGQGLPGPAALPALADSRPTPASAPVLFSPSRQAGGAGRGVDGPGDGSGTASRDALQVLPDWPVSEAGEATDSGSASTLATSAPESWGGGSQVGDALPPLPEWAGGLEGEASTSGSTSISPSDPEREAPGGSLSSVPDWATDGLHGDELLPSPLPRAPSPAIKSAADLGGLPNAGTPPSLPDTDHGARATRLTDQGPFSGGFGVEESTLVPADGHMAGPPPTPPAGGDGFQARKPLGRDLPAMPAFGEGLEAGTERGLDLPSLPGLGETIRLEIPRSENLPSPTPLGKDEESVTEEELPRLYEVPSSGLEAPSVDLRPAALSDRLRPFDPGSPPGPEPPRFDGEAAQEAPQATLPLPPPPSPGPDINRRSASSASGPLPKLAGAPPSSSSGGLGVPSRPRPQVPAPPAGSTDRAQPTRSQGSTAFQVLTGTPKRLADKRLSLEVSGKGTVALKMGTVRGVACAKIEDGQRGTYNVLDLLIESPNPAAVTVRIVRLVGSQFDPRTLLGEQLDPEVAFLGLVLWAVEQSSASLQVGGREVRQRRLPVFSSLGDYEASLRSALG